MEQQLAQNRGLHNLPFAFASRFRARSRVCVSGVLGNVLRSNLCRLLDDDPAFRLSADSGTVADREAFDFHHCRDHFVIWPLENTISSAWGFFSALRDGVVPIVVPGRWSDDKIAKIRELFPDFGFFDGAVINLRGNRKVRDRDVFLALLTSGSTGDPQLIATTEERLVRGIQFIHEAQNLDQIRRTGILLPISYSYSLINQLFWGILYEREIYLCSCRLGPHGSLQKLDEIHSEMICMVAAQVSAIRQVDHEETFRMEKVRSVNFAGAPFPMGQFPYLQKVFPNAQFFNNYGCTEAMPRLTVRRVADEFDDVSHVGSPIGDVEIRIGGEDLIGPIFFRGSSTAIGRLAADGTLLPFDDWIQSGDWGTVREGDLYLAGRRDQVVKIQGERFSLLEVEKTLMSLGFNHAVAWLDSSSNTIVAAVSDNASPSKSSIRKVCKESLAKLAWPRRIYALKEWPLNTNRKTDRKMILKLHRDGQLTNNIV